MNWSVKYTLIQIDMFIHGMNTLVMVLGMIILGMTMENITNEEAIGLIHKIKKRNLFAIDLETSELDPIVADIVGISFIILKNLLLYLFFL